ncbi:MAG: hypothetical protein IKP06_06065 [Elusimicrobiaceae bacterium]|nr:hypothetical protein [Elusimicrobiaceae bacterium]
MPCKKTNSSLSCIKSSKAVTLRYQPEFCDKLLAFFDVPPFHITEVTKRDGSVSMVETAAELPTFAAFAKQIGTTCEVLKMWENKHAAFREAAQKARDLQSNILIQNSLRGNYSASFAVFTAKNLLGWKDGKEDLAVSPPICVRWEE